MAVNIGQLTAALQPQAPLGMDKQALLARTNPLHFTAEGLTGPLGSEDELGLDGLGGALGSIQGATGTASSSAGSATSFADSLLKAMDGVNASQTKSEGLVQQMLVNPDSVDAQDVTISMAEANMTLNIARTILNRVVTAWKDVINTR